VIPPPHTLALFAAAAFLLAVVPGPAVIYIVTQSVDGGRLAGIVSALGIASGALVHVAFAAVGLSALLLRSAVAFEVVKYAGAVYLIVLGVRRLLTKDVEADPDVVHERSHWRLYRQGVVVNVLNPKTALFFFAFLPQFVNPDAGRVGVQIALLGLVFIAVAFTSDMTYALVAGTAGRWLKESRGYVRAQRWVSGTVFIGLGVATALSGSRGNGAIRGG
jgi:threonine/homoserine/homoserine lactone efflux protein